MIKIVRWLWEMQCWGGQCGGVLVREGREEYLQMDVWRGNLISRWCNKTETS